MDGAPRLVITAGDPSGIGPEVVLKALTHRRLESSRVLILGDRRVFDAAHRRLRLPPLRWRMLGAGARWTEPRGVTLQDFGHRHRFRPGHSDRHAGAAAADYLDAAIGLWRHGQLDALVTAPLTKSSVALARRGFTGHTEYLAGATRARHVVMMFVSPHLRVVLLTRHLPLRRVARALTPGDIRVTLQVTVDAMRRQFGLRHPRLVVCGLNPHAGEAGRLGHEEQRLLAPALRAVRRARLIGPVAADGYFAAPSEGDAVVCWYHDQGLIPFKMAARDTGCQVTLGLPFVRTSPDHGTALDLAGQGRAHPGSMGYAIDTAQRLVARRRDATRT